MRLCTCIGYVSLTLGEVGGVHEQRDYKMSASTECPGVMDLEQADWSKCKAIRTVRNGPRTDKIGGSRLSKAMVGGFGKHRESDAWFFREGK